MVPMHLRCFRLIFDAFNFVAYSPASLHFFEKKLDWKSVQYVLLFWEKIRYKVRHVRAPLLQAVSSWSITFLEEGLEEAGAASMSDAVSSASDTDAQVEGKKKRGGQDARSQLSFLIFIIFPSSNC